MKGLQVHAWPTSADLSVDWRRDVEGYKRAAAYAGYSRVATRDCTPWNWMPAQDLTFCMLKQFSLSEARVMQGQRRISLWPACSASPGPGEAIGLQFTPFTLIRVFFAEEGR